MEWNSISNNVLPVGISLPHASAVALETLRHHQLVCFSHLRWDSVFQRPQHLLTRNAKMQRVLFFEEPIRDSAEPWLEMSNVRNGLWVAVPHMPSDLDEAGSIAAQRHLLEQALGQQEIEQYISWYYTPMALPFSRHLTPAAVVYDCMDELSNFRGAPPQLRQLEAELFSRADVVFTGGRSLYEAKKGNHPNIHPFPSSIDGAHFRQARAGLPDPSDQARLPRPRLGFFGVIDERLDTRLLAEVAATRPAWQLVMVGPVVKIDPAELPRADNIHYLGRKPYEELPSYLANWDVALLPFACNDATRFISPTKTPEYLAAGKPVVSTPIRDVVDPYGDEGLVAVAGDTAGFIAAVEAALTSGCDSAWLARVDEHLKSMSWDETWARMMLMVSEHLPAVTGLPPAGTSPATVGRSIRSRGLPFDYLVVGAGFAGSVLAERLASAAGKRVLVVERRNHIGGNAFDGYDEAGVLVHRYGPHIFHTNSRDVFDYLSRFTEWRPYEHRVLASVDGQLVPIPINLDTVNRLYGLNLTSLEVNDFFLQRAEPKERVLTSEDVVVSRIGRELYEKFFRGYTRKQWGLDPSELDATVAGRVPTRTNRDARYFTDTYQALPKHGYTRMFERMLAHPNIKVMLQTDYREVKDLMPHAGTIYTGPIDEYFDYCYGKLPYRSLEFRFETHRASTVQAVGTINFPNEHAYTRVTEFKHLTGQEHPFTSLVYEYPQADGDPYYPVPRPENAQLYRRYKELADKVDAVHFVGRLATYHYFNMDQVVAQALTLYGKMTGKGRVAAAAQAGGVRIDQA